MPRDESPRWGNAGRITTPPQGRGVIRDPRWLYCMHFDLDLLPHDMKINREHLLYRVNNCTKFNNSQAKGSKDTKWRFHLYKDLHVDHDFLPHDMKINREHLLFRKNHCTNTSNYQATGSLDIEGTTFTKIWGLTMTFYNVTWKQQGASTF